MPPTFHFMHPNEVPKVLHFSPLLIFTFQRLTQMLSAIWPPFEVIAAVTHFGHFLPHWEKSILLARYLVFQIVYVSLPGNPTMLTRSDRYSGLLAPAGILGVFTLRSKCDEGNTHHTLTPAPTPPCYLNPLRIVLFTRLSNGKIT